jgi:hypothetical protein
LSEILYILRAPELVIFGGAMSYGFSDPFSAAPPSVQIRRVGGWKGLAGLMVAALGVGFAGYVYMSPYQKATKALQERTAELSKQRGSTDDLSSERDRLKAEMEKRQAAEQEKAAGASKRHETLSSVGAELKTALSGAGAAVAADDARVTVSFATANLFEQPTSVAISTSGETALRVVVAAVKKAGGRARVKARLIPSPPPRELGQFKNIGEFEMLRAARVMLVLAASGVPGDHLSVAGDVPGPRKTKNGIPDRLDIEIEAE